MAQEEQELGGQKFGNRDLGSAVENHDLEWLKRSEARYRSMVENTSDIITLLDAEGKILYVSPSAIAITGYEPHEILGRNAFSFIHPDDYETLQDALNHIVIEGKGHTHSYRIRCADGSWRWLETTGCNLMSDADIQAIVVDSRDVTELKQARQTVEEILESTMDAVFSVDHNWKFTYLNSRAATIFGYAAHELLGKSLWEVAPTAVRTKFFQQYHKALREQVAVAFEEYSQASHSWFEVRAYPTRSGLSVYFRDISEQKRTEIALEESEQRYRSVVSGAALVIWALDTNGVFTMSDGNLLSHLGLRPSELVGRSIFEVYAAQPAILDDTRRALQGEEVLSEHTVGNIVFHTSCRPLFHNGVVTGIIGVATDITQRKQAEKLLIERARTNALRGDISNALMRNQNLHEMLQSCAQALLHHFDAVLARIWVMQDEDFYPNPLLEMHASAGLITAVEGPFHYIELGEHIVGNIAATRHPYLTNRLNEDSHFQETSWAHQEKIVGFAGYPLILKDEVIGVIAIFSRHELDEQALKLLNTITTKIALGIERQRALLKVRQSEERYRSLVDVASQIVWQTDAAGRVTDMPAWRAFTGQTAEEVHGFGWMDAIHPQDRAQVEQAWQQALHTQSTYRVEFRLRKYNGTYEYFVDRGVPLLEADGTVREWVGMSTNITERKRAEAEVTSFTAKLQQSNRELQEFAYVASHDLQEPLRKIQMFADLLQQQCSDSLPPEGHEYLQRMQNASRRMQNLIQSILSLSRVATTGQEFEEVDLTTIVQEVLSDLEVQLLQTTAHVQVDTLCTIQADPSQMRQLFQNLISNALKFHRPEVPPHIEIESVTLLDQNACRIVVRDNGIGFDEEYADRIFLPFRRLHGHSQYEGSGMGLAICRRIAERHGGTITVQSTLGTGTTFTITLQLQQDSAEIVAGSDGVRA
jgi:PAS domain S-box-containing protein